MIIFHVKTSCTNRGFSLFQSSSRRRSSLWGEIWARAAVRHLGLYPCAKGENPACLVGSEGFVWKWSAHTNTPTEPQGHFQDSGLCRGWPQASHTEFCCSSFGALSICCWCPWHQGDLSNFPKWICRLSWSFKSNINEMSVFIKWRKRKGISSLLGTINSW